MLLFRFIKIVYFIEEVQPNITLVIDAIELFEKFELNFIFWGHRYFYVCTKTL